MVSCQRLSNRSVCVHNSRCLMFLVLLDKCIGSKLWIIMKSGTEFVGRLQGFDDYVNIVLEEVEEFEKMGDVYLGTKVGTILLNGSGITMMIPGGEGPLRVKQTKIQK